MDEQDKFEQELAEILAIREERPDENARKRAVNLALAAYDEGMAEERNNISQGKGLWARLTGNSNLKGRSDKMNKKLVFGGMATAMVVVMAAGLSLQMGSTRMEAGDTMMLVGTAPGEAVSESYSQPITDYNITQVEEAIKRRESAMPVPTGAVRGRMGMEAESFAAAAPPAAQARMAQEMVTADVAVSNYAGAPGIAIMPPPDVPGYYQPQGHDKFEDVKDNAVKSVKTDPVSTFSVDVDTASYSVVRRQINNGVMPQPGSVRIEEMINYFDYDYALPEDKAQPFKPSVTVLPSPWAEGRKLVHIGIKGFDIAEEAKPRSNLVFLIDVSGSMSAPDKLPLLKSSMKMLLDTLSPEDSVAIVTYAGRAGTALEPTKIAEKDKIIAAIDGFTAGGSTAGAAGIEQAYRLAEAQKEKMAAEHKDKKIVSRIILATDGDFNVGARSPDELKKMVEAKRKSGVFLSVLGFGLGNLNDHMMQTLAQNGNGVAAYIDNLNEARKVLVEEASSTLFTIAKDVKIQVDFNPATVAEYRLIGYETRALNREDFNNDAVDAGDIGAGHSVTAIYEITPVGGPVLIEPSRYEDKAEDVTAVPMDNEFGNEYAFLKMRYKLPGDDISKLITTPITTADEVTPSDDVNWAVAVAGFGQLLKGGQYMSGYGYDEIIETALKAKGADAYGYRAEFINIVRLAQTLDR